MDPELKKFFNVQQTSENEVTIHIYGVIGLDEAWWDEGTNNVAFAIVTLIRDLEKQYGVIHIRINSPGGYIDDGLAIYNAIKYSVAETHTYNDGIVASMAGIIFVAGKVTHAPKTSIHHAHSASTITVGNVKDHEETIKSLQAYEDALAQAYSERMNKTKDEIKAMWFDGAEHYMTGEEAYQQGLIDVLEEANVNIPSNVTNFSYKQLLNLYKEKPEQKDKKNKTEKRTSLLNKMGKGLKSVFATAEIENEKTIKNFENMRDLPFILALLALDFIKTDDDGKAVLDRAQAVKVEAELKRLSDLDKQVVDLTAEKQNLEKDLKTANDSVTEKDAKITELTTSLEEKDALIAELQAKLEQKPGASSTTVVDKSKGGKSPDGVDWDAIDNLSHNKEADECL